MVKGGCGRGVFGGNGLGTEGGCRGFRGVEGGCGRGVDGGFGRVDGGLGRWYGG